MRIENKLRATSIRSNARHRGPSEMEKYANFILESVHDLKLLGATLDRNDMVEGHRGQSDFIDDNFKAYVSGGSPVTASVDTAGTLRVPMGEAFPGSLLADSAWAPYGQVQKQGTGNFVTLTDPGLMSPAGIGRQVYVEEGDILNVRLKVSCTSGRAQNFSIGSRNVNQGIGDMTTFPLPENGGTIYVEKRLYCKHREPITLNIDVHTLPAGLAPATVEIVEADIQYLNENNVALLPVNTDLKRRINALEDDLAAIIANL